MWPAVIGVIWNIWLWSSFASSFRHDQFAVYLPNAHANGCRQVYQYRACCVWPMHKVKGEHGFVCFRTLTDFPPAE